MGYVWIFYLKNSEICDIMSLCSFAATKGDNSLKYYILYNPLAGHGGWEKALSDVKEMLNDAECLNVIDLSDYKELYEKLTPEDTVVLLGGDGTINKFVNATEGYELPFDVLYYPTGTGNNFVRDLKDVDTSRPFSIKKYITDLPKVTVNGQTYRFLNGVGFGIDGYCCEVGDKIKAESDKPVNYTAIAIKGLLFHFSAPNATVTVDGKSYEYKKVWIAPTMNGRYYGGGMMPTPDQDRLADEKKVSLMLFHGSGKLKTLMIFPSLFKGEHVKHTECIAIHKGKDITVTFDKPTSLQIDGETLLNVTEYKVTV